MKRAIENELSFSDCFRFPIREPGGLRDILIGGTLLFTLLIGWIFNLGHRLEIIHRLHHREPPYFRGFSPWGATFVRGLQAWSAIAIYLSPAAVLGILAFYSGDSGIRAIPRLLWTLSGMFFILGVYTLPGGMTHNAAFDDMSYLYRPDKALSKAVAGGRRYLKAWVIALCAIGLSFLGLAVLGFGFFYTSVWAWLVVGYAFSRALLPAPSGGTGRA